MVGHLVTEDDERALSDRSDYALFLPVEPTAAMIEAGTEALHKSGIAEIELESDAIAVENIYRAMFDAYVPGLVVRDCYVVSDYDEGFHFSSSSTVVTNERKCGLWDIGFAFVMTLLFCSLPVLLLGHPNVALGMVICSLIIASLTENALGGDK